MDTYEDTQWDRDYQSAWKFRSTNTLYRTHVSFTSPGRALAYAEQLMTALPQEKEAAQF